jgi:hypothetical protein
MKVFLSWSGERSKVIAKSLSEWLEQVLQAVEPWISTDIEKGKRWDGEISQKLEQSKVGIICLTKDNLESTWLHFEAGAISKTPDAYVCTFLYDITPANVKEPLSLFQATQYNKEDVLKLLKTINNLLDKQLKESTLEGIFNTFWPQLEVKLKDIPGDKTKNTDVRSDRELLEETLQIVRTLKENSTPSSVAPQLAPISYNERLKTLWLEFSDVNKYSLEQMNSDESKIMEFRRYGQSHGIAAGPVALLRQFFARLLREKPV